MDAAGASCRLCAGGVDHVGMGASCMDAAAALRVRALAAAA